MDGVAEDTLSHAICAHTQIGEADGDGIEGGLMRAHKDVGIIGLTGCRCIACRHRHVVGIKHRTIAKLATRRCEFEAEGVAGVPSTADELLHGMDLCLTLNIKREVGYVDGVDLDSRALAFGIGARGGELRLGHTRIRRVLEAIPLRRGAKCGGIRAVGSVESTGARLHHAVVDPVIVKVDEVCVRHVARQVTEGHRSRARVVVGLRNRLHGRHAGKPILGAHRLPGGSVVRVGGPLKPEVDVVRGSATGPDLLHREVALHLVDEGDVVGRIIGELREGFNAQTREAAVLKDLELQVKLAVAKVDGRNQDVLNALVNAQVTGLGASLFHGIDKASVLHARGYRLAPQGLRDAIRVAVG